MTYGSPFGAPLGGEETVLTPGALADLGSAALLARFSTDDPYGTDLPCTLQTDLGFTLIAGRRALAEAMLRRLTTPRGGLFYDADYGTDVREILLSRLSAQKLFQWKAQIEQECMKDDRVSDATAELTFSSTTEELLIELEVETGEGPFEMTLSVTQFAVRIGAPPPTGTVSGIAISGAVAPQLGIDAALDMVMG